MRKKGNQASDGELTECVLGRKAQGLRLNLSARRAALEHDRNPLTRIPVARTSLEAARRRTLFVLVSLY
jgi:hypothetical protein